MKNSGASLGGRIKGYEEVFKQKLIRRMPVIIRVDGKAFHTLTKIITPAIDPSEATGPGEMLHEVMIQTAQGVASKIQNCVFAYTQSDEISFLLKDWDTHETEQWFGGNVQKLASVTASFTTGQFADEWHNVFNSKVRNGFFDARVFNLAVDEVANYFIWRQQDCTRNSVRMVGSKYFSHKEMEGRNNSEVQDMLWRQHGVNWNHLVPWKRRGSCVYKHRRDGDERLLFMDDCPPIFTQDRYYIEKHLEVKDDE